MISNIRSLEFRRASMGQLQEYLAQVDKEITKQKEWNDQQTEYMSNIELHLSELLSVCDQMNHEILRLNKLIATLTEARNGSRKETK